MVFRPRDLASRMAGRRKPDDGYLRETFTLSRDKARARARDFLDRYPKAAYMSSVESWRELARWRHRIHDAPACERRLGNIRLHTRIASTLRFLPNSDNQVFRYSA